MELRQLEYLVAVLDEGSFTRAASRLEIVQSAVSHHVGELEKELKVQLVRRQRPRVLATPAGELFAARARRILAEVRAARDELSSLSGLTVGEVGFGATIPAASLDVPGLLAAFRNQYPGVRVRLREGTGPELISMVRDDVIDMAVVSVALGDLPGGIAGQVIDSDHLVLVGPVGHPFEQRTEVPVTDLDGLDLISFREGSSLRHAAELVLTRAEVTPNIVIESNEMPVLVGLVAHGLGLAILPRAFVQQAGVAIWGRPLVPSIDPPLTLVWRDTRRRSQAVDAFLHHVIEAAPKELGALSGKE
jgi:LysR family transcriptional regulator, transcription activator of glutamate synthase operon